MAGLACEKLIYFAVVFLTEGNTIRDNKSEFGKLSEWFDMVCVKFTAFPITTWVLAGVIITLKNLFTPYFIFLASSYKKIPGSNSVFPVASLFAHSRLAKASTRAKEAFFKTILMTVVRFFTKVTYFVFTFSEPSIKVDRIKFLLQSSYMALSAAINTFFDQRWINIKSLFTNWTNSIFTASFSHHYNYNSIEEVNQYA